MIFFTSDLHLSHKRIAEVRQFPSVEIMDELIIANWNKTVNDNDVVYVLGDVSLHLRGEEFARILNRLNGKRFYLVPGNHDKLKNLPSGQFNILDHVACISIEKTPVVLCHYAMLVWPKSHYGSYLLYGHSHGGLRGKAGFLGKAVDVSLDCWEYTPVSWDRIKTLMISKPDNFNLLKKTDEVWPPQDEPN